MKNSLVALVLLVVLSLFALQHGGSALASWNDGRQEATAPAHYQHGPTHAFKPEFENDSVQVVRITIGPHEKLPMHDLTPRVVILLTNQDLRLTFPNGETREEHHVAGETMWVSGQRHAGENLSDKPIEFIAVIPKQK